MKTFLENLTKELKKNQLNEQDIMEIIQDHEQMIKEAIEDGLNEADIKEKFGNPEDLAKDLAETFESENNEENVTDEDSSNEEPYTFDCKDVSGLLIKVLDEDIDIEPSETGQYQVYCVGGKKSNYKVFLSGGTLHIERKNSTSIKFRIFRPSTSCDFKLYVPQDHQLKDVKIQSKSSDVDIEHLNAEIFSLESLSGDVDLEYVKATQFYLKTLSGDADIEHCQFGQVDMSLVSGDVDLEYVEIKEDMKISTVSGDVDADHTTCKDLIYRAVSGDFEGNEFYPTSVSLKSVSGDISIENENKEKDIDVRMKKTISGDINL